MADHKAEPRNVSNPDMEARRVSLGLGHYRCKCGRAIVEAARPGVAGFGPEAFYWRHLPTNNR